jgi:hypothetical protein
MRKHRSEMSPEKLQALREYERNYQRNRRHNMLARMSDVERTEYFKDLYEERRIKWAKKLFDSKKLLG